MTKRLIQISRLFLGVVFLFAGINGFFVILGLEPFIATSPEAMTLFQFKYLLVVEKTLEILCGVLLITNQYIPLTLIILSPIIANIILLHLFIDPSLLLLAIIIGLALCFLLFCYRKNFMSILERNPKPY
ncbi:hypothetical protein KO561_00135 [Radiobacillus kanasensis]|uniref:hypothetical protein n=1 Tax=Radiobacillus kanasensis TaxID=2844358 RepID=UPI001E3A8A55|nr:hypothetical protein [Radiobacillus kanasensis]UFT99451.1 hypothetical protein KO561_00135 [Radiobacillus kanasensis]